MQLHVDTDTETVAGLMLLSRLLIDYANMKAQQDKALEESYPKPLDPARSQPAVLTVGPITSGQLEAGMKVTDEQGRDLGVVDSQEPDPAVIFGKFPVPTGASPTPPVSNVVPLFPQPALNLPGATGPAALVASTVSPVNVTAAPAVQTPSLPSVGNAGASSVSVASAEVDSQGIPWDERIHSSSKKKKGDGTWILKRGVDHTLAQTITAELIAAKLNAHQTNAPTVPQALPTLPVPHVGGASPVAGVASVNPTVPLPLPPSVPVPTPPPGVSTGTVALPATGAVPVPGVTAAGAVPVPEVNPVKRFGAMMAKVSQALGAKTITQQQVLDAHVAVGLQQLQQAVLNPDKIPLIEAALGLA